MMNNSHKTKPVPTLGTRLAQVSIKRPKQPQTANCAFVKNLKLIINPCQTRANPWHELFEAKIAYLCQTRAKHPRYLTKYLCRIYNALKRIGFGTGFFNLQKNILFSRNNFFF